jgi:molybdopterin converting factor small subunit
MSITLNIHKTHRAHTNGLESVEIEGNTVGECLEALCQRFPDMKSALFDNKGKVRNHIEIYVNAQSAYPDELRKKVKPGDEVTITVMLAGG